MSRSWLLLGAVSLASVCRAQPLDDAGVAFDAGDDLHARLAALEAEVRALKAPERSAPSPDPNAPLDVREPPFSLADWS